MGNEIEDVHLIVQPKGWKPPAGEGRSAKMEATILAVIQGPDATRKAIGRDRNIGVFRLDRSDVPVPAYATMKEAALTDDGQPPALEIMGYAEHDTKEGKPIVYLTAQKARVHDGPIPAGAGQTTDNVGAGGFAGSPMTAEDRERIVACWSIEQAREQAMAGGPGVDVAATIEQWAPWYAEQCYRLGSYIGANVEAWKAASAPPPEAHQRASQPPGAAEAPGDDYQDPGGWDAPAEAQTGAASGW